MSKRDDRLENNSEGTVVIWSSVSADTLDGPLETYRDRKVKIQARNDAEKKFPAADSVAPQGLEASIWNDTIKHSRSLVNHFDSQVEAAEDHIRAAMSVKKYDASPADENIRNKNGVDRIVDDRRADIVAAERRRLENMAHLRQFKSRHNLTRRALEPASIYFVIGVILICVFIETLANGYIFRDVADGLTGGVLLAAGLSFANVIMGIGFGYFCLRTFNSKARHGHEMGLKVKKGFALVGASLLFAAAVFLNLYIAHYRELASSYDGNSLPFLNAMDVISDPFALHEPMAFLLLFIGFAIFAIAVYEGYGKFSDPVPGYTKASHNFDESEEAYEDEVAGLKDEIRHFFENVRTSLRRRSSMEKRRVDAAHASLSELVANRNGHRSGITEALSDGNRLLSLYRKENVYHRLGVDIPRFAEFISENDVHEKGESLLAEIDDIEALVATYEKTYEGNARAIDTTLSQLDKSESDALSRLDEDIASWSRKVADEMGYGNDMYVTNSAESRADEGAKATLLKA